MNVVIDMNMFVSSVFGGPPREVARLWFQRRITKCLSEEIFQEYQRVLREIGAVSEAEERDLISAFTFGENVLYVNDPPSVKVVEEDPDDDKFIACALALEADYIVSGDSDLLSLGSYMGIPIVSPSTFLEILDAPSEHREVLTGSSSRNYRPAVAPADGSTTTVPGAVWPRVSGRYIISASAGGCSKVPAVVARAT
jgi:putative PIN family toxin of toxin-antitoxin system